MVTQDFASPLFTLFQDKRNPPIILNASSFYDRVDGHYRCNNLAARIEHNGLISNIYFNQDKTGIQRIGIKRGNGGLQHVKLEEGEEIIGCYGNYIEI